jgi:WD40 repeat protein
MNFDNKEFIGIQIPFDIISNLPINENIVLFGTTHGKLILFNFNKNENIVIYFTIFLNQKINKIGTVQTIYKEIKNEKTIIFLGTDFQILLFNLSDLTEKLEKVKKEKKNLNNFTIQPFSILDTTLEHTKIFPYSLIHNDGIESNKLCFNKQDNILISGGGDGIIYLWDIQKNCLFDYIKNNENEGLNKNKYILTLNYSKKNNLIFSGYNNDNIVKVWDLKNKKNIKNYKPFESSQQNFKKKYISSISLDDKNENWVAFGGFSNFVEVYNIETNNCILTLQTGFSVNDILFLDKIILVGENEKIYFYEKDGKLFNYIKSDLPSIYNINNMGNNSTNLVASGITNEVFFYRNYQKFFSYSL